MSISGHKTRAIFSRYNITDATDVREALIQVGKYNDKIKRAGRKRARVVKIGANQTRQQRPRSESGRVR
jgi:hypothetical protein